MYKKRKNETNSSEIILPFSGIVFVSLTVSGIFAWIIYPESGLNFAPNKSGVDFLFSYFKIPMKIFITILTSSTALFALYKIFISQKALELQSLSYLHNALNDRVMSLRSFIDEVTSKETSFSLSEINTSKLFSFLFPESWAKKDFFDEEAGKANINRYKKSISYFEEMTQNGSLDEKQYIEHVQHYCDELGIQASIEDIKSAYDAESDLILLLNRITKSWMFVGENLISHKPTYITAAAD